MTIAIVVSPSFEVVTKNFVPQLGSQKLDLTLLPGTSQSDFQGLQLDVSSPAVINEPVKGQCSADSARRRHVAAIMSNQFNSQ